MPSTVNMDIRRTSSNRMLSMPIPVHVGGWTSDTLTLQRNGWDFYVEYEIHYMTYNLALVSRRGNGTAVSFHNRMDDNVMEMYGMTTPPPIIISHMSPGLSIEEVYNGRKEAAYGRRYHAISMEPTSLDQMTGTAAGMQMMREHEKYTRTPMELMLFRPDDRNFEAKAPDMVIKEQDTDELLALLKDKFADSDEEYYESKGAGLITDQKEIQRHLHLVSVR